MRNRHEPLFQMPYPTDKYGEAIHPTDLGYLAEWESPELPRNNHHFAWMARQFGSTAIGQAYRDLEVNQTLLVIDEHTHLHHNYSHLPLPHPEIMLDRIEGEREAGNHFQIYNLAQKAYELIEISEEKIEELEGTWRARE